jgi:hypothetical protein
MLSAISSGPDEAAVLAHEVLEKLPGALAEPTASGSRGDGEPHEPSGGHAGS